MLAAAAPEFLSKTFTIQITGEGEYNDDGLLPIFQAELSDFTPRTR